MPQIKTRPAIASDLALLPAVERSAASRFSPAQNPAADPELAWIADAPVMSAEEFGEYCDAQAAVEGRWLSVAVSVDAVEEVGTEGAAAAGEEQSSGAKDEHLVGFVAFKRLDMSIFIAEMSVAAEWQGCGVGGKLIAAVQEVADDETQRPGHDMEDERGSQAVKKAERSLRGMLSLTTDRFAAWNAPFYARRGFVEVDANLVGMEHVSVLREEGAEKGLDPRRRCCMVRIKDAGGKWSEQRAVLQILIRNMQLLVG